MKMFLRDVLKNKVVVKTESVFEKLIFYIQTK